MKNFKTANNLIISFSLNDKNLHLLFAEESTRASPITVSVGRRVLCVIVVVVGTGQDGAYTAGSN